MTLALLLFGVWLGFSALAVCLCCAAAEGDRRLLSGSRRSATRRCTTERRTRAPMPVAAGQLVRRQ